MCLMLRLCTPIGRAEGQLREGVIVSSETRREDAAFVPKRSPKLQQRHQSDDALHDDAFQGGVERLEQPSQLG